MTDEQFAELMRQLTDGNGLASPDTQGMTLRELVLENRVHIAELKNKAPTWVTRRELLGAVVTAVGLGIAAVGLWF